MISKGTHFSTKLSQPNFPLSFLSPLFPPYSPHFNLYLFMDGNEYVHGSYFDLFYSLCYFFCYCFCWCFYYYWLMVKLVLFVIIVVCYCFCYIIVVICDYCSCFSLFLTIVVCCYYSYLLPLVGYFYCYNLVILVFELLPNLDELLCKEWKVGEKKVEIKTVG